MENINNIPIVILSKDRLEPLKLLVNSLKKRNYNNIIVIDNRSTYQKLLDWYKISGVDVFYNNIDQTLYDTGAFYRLACEIKHPKFVNLIKDYYVFTDSDVVPIDEAPEDFISGMVEVCAKYRSRKVGLGLKIDDLPYTEYSKKIIDMEIGYWTKKIFDEKYEIYQAGIDTTFAVYQPNSTPLLDMNVIRMGGNYIARHYPWYYDINNLPEDESYYIRNLTATYPTYSTLIKKKLNQ